MGFAVAGEGCNLGGGVGERGQARGGGEVRSTRAARKNAAPRTHTSGSGDFSRY